MTPNLPDTERTPDLQAPDAQPVLIIGVGNPDRGDDAIGWIAAERLAALAPPGARILRCSGDILALIESWRAAAAVILMDASSPQPASDAPGAQPSGRPGTLLRIDAAAEGLPAALTNHSTHGFGVAEAIELARALGVLPPTVLVYAVEGETFEAGAPLSPAAAAALETLIDRVAGEARTLLRSSGVEPPEVTSHPAASDRTSR